MPSVPGAIACVPNAWNRTGAPSTYMAAAPSRDPRIAMTGATPIPISPPRSTTAGARIRAWRESSTGSARRKSPLMTVSDVSGATPAVSRGGAPEVSRAACELRHPGITTASNVAALERHRLMTVARASRSAVLEIAPQFVAGPVGIGLDGAQRDVQVVGERPVVYHAVEQREQRPLVAAHQFAERRLVTLLRPRHDLLVAGARQVARPIFRAYDVPPRPPVSRARGGCECGR